MGAVSAVLTPNKAVNERLRLDKVLRTLPVTLALNVSVREGMKSKRTRKLEGDIGAFLKQYKRKAHAGWDPNDRRYDRELEEKIKHMSPEELNDLMYGSDDDELEEK